MSRQRAIIASEANRHEKQRDQQAVPECVEAALDVCLVFGFSEYIAQEICTGDTGHTAEPFGRNGVDQYQRQDATWNRLIGRELAQLENHGIQPALCRGVSNDEE